jgi:hypothetical protein
MGPGRREEMEGDEGTVKAARPPKGRLEAA